MKSYPQITSLIAATVLATGSFATAQTVVKETTTTNLGTITEFSPETIVIRSETAPEPVRYRYSKTTTYVDEAGTPVSMELVKSGLPVTVYYTKVGDQMVATKVIVRKVTVAPAAVEKTTTTTTTTRKKE